MQIRILNAVYGPMEVSILMKPWGYKQAVNLNLLFYKYNQVNGVLESWHAIFPVFSGSRNNKTFKPKKNIPEGTHQYELMRHAAVTLGSGDLRQAVVLPEGEDLNEWVAVNSE